MLFQELSFSATIGAISSAFAVYVVARSIYDLFFHPLRNFPGPKRAAIWSFYEFYFDVIKDGTYLWEIEKMHQKYGPIIRINSRSLHIHDPEYYHSIYAGSGRKVSKEPSAVSGYTFPHSTISTIDHDLHRKRRAILNPYFSKRAVADIEPVIHDRLGALISRIAESKGSTVDLTCAFSAFTADVATYHFYGCHANYVSSEGFKYGLKDALTVLLNLYNLTRFLPLPADTLKSLPLPILGLINPNFPKVVSAREDNKQMVLSYLNKPDEEKRAIKDARSKSVIVSALTDRNIPEEERTLDRLLDEGETIILAGIDTTARTLSVALFHLLNNKEVLMKLRKELAAIEKPNAQRWTTAELEAVPYMRGVVQEAIRLTYGLVVRIPRISPHEALQYNGFIIPPGTPVSQSTYLINNDASVFPNPQMFDPERWVQAAQDGVSLDKYMVSFSKGSRACIGINLAYAQIYLGIARVATSFDMELFETTQKDVNVYHTRGFAFPKDGDGAVKARVTGPCQRE